MAHSDKDRLTIYEEADVRHLPTQVDRIADELEMSIATGKLPAGGRLGEEALAKRFGVSRGPLREALRRVEGRKLVVRMPHAGVRVVALSRQDAIELYELREILESSACAIAARNMSTRDFDDLDTLLDGHLQDPELFAGRSYVQAHGAADFHWQIARRCGNDRLATLICEENYSLIRLVRINMNRAPGRPLEALEEHREIVRALRRRDSELAQLLMRRHLGWARRILAESEAAWFLPSSQPSEQK